MKTAWKLSTGIVAVIVGIATWNYFSVSRPVAARLAKDDRNDKVSVWAYHQYGVVPSVLVFDLRGVSDQAAQLDVMRALFHSAEGLKESQFDRVLLSHRGIPKLMLDGAHFRKIGEEFATQNPIFTIRTLPENVKKLDGSAAYGTWTGGMLGVLGKQMEDVTKFSQDWYLGDLTESAKR